MFLDSTCASAGFALLVERIVAGQGPGRLLLQTLMRAARAGMQELWSHVVHDNAAMQDPVQAHAGALARVPGAAGVVCVRIAL